MVDQLFFRQYRQLRELGPNELAQEWTQLAIARDQRNLAVVAPQHSAQPHQELVLLFRRVGEERSPIRVPVKLLIVLGNRQVNDTCTVAWELVA
jgi:hypothetical protein